MTPNDPPRLSALGLAVPVRGLHDWQDAAGFAGARAMAAAAAAWQTTLPAALAERAMSLVHTGIALPDEACEAPWRRELAVHDPGRPAA